MKGISWIIFIGYILLFLVLGLIFYKKYWQEFFNTGQKPITVTSQNTEKIFYTDQKNLYSFNPALISTEISSSILKLPSTGPIEAVDGLNNLIVYALQDKSGASQIWELNLATNKTEEIIETGKIKDINSFDDPKIAPNGEIAFIGRGNTNDRILIKSSANFLGSIETGFKIADFSWSRDSQKIAYCSQSLPQNICHVYQIKNNQIISSFEKSVNQISWNKGPMIMLSENNLYFSSDGVKINPITQVAGKIISRFSLSSSGESLAFSLGDGHNFDIYSVKTDGTNMIQLTADHKNSSPVASPDGQTVAYEKNGEGIYQISLKDLKEEKLINSNEPITVQLWE